MLVSPRAILKGVRRTRVAAAWIRTGEGIARAAAGAEPQRRAKRDQRQGKGGPASSRTGAHWILAAAHEARTFQHPIFP